MQKKVSIERSISLGDIGLHEPAGAEKAVFTFLNWAEAVATRWIQHRAGILLLSPFPVIRRAAAAICTCGVKGCSTVSTCRAWITGSCHRKNSISWSGGSG